MGRLRTRQRAALSPPEVTAAVPEGARDRRSRILGGRGGGRSLLIATVSTIVFFTALTLVVVTAPGWPEVREAFFYWPEFKESFPDILEQFGTNVKLFLVAEVFILAWGLVLAVLRSLPGPVFFPLRFLSAAYTDIFRGIPTILLVFLQLAHILRSEQLRKWRRGAIIAIFVFAAVITPSQDPITLFAMAVPMYAFYELSILLGRVLKR